MPHIKVKPFDTKKIKDCSIAKFSAINNRGDEIVLINKNNTKIFLNIVKKEGEYLIKPNTVTRGSDSEFLKEILNDFAKELNLEITHQNTIVKDKKPKIKSEALKTIEDFYNFDTSFDKAELEVGFGSGRHILYKASKNKDTLYIGVEIHTPSIEQVLKQINLRNLKNLIVVKYDARLLLEMLKSNFLDKIYVHFPVPWDKKPHRRVINQKFINEALRVLKKDSQLELRTDSKNYFEYSLNIFSSLKESKFSVYKNMDIEVTSKYEDRWKRLQKDIYTLNLYSLEVSKPNILPKGFDLSLKEYKDNFLTEPVVRDDYFVHISKVFKIKNQEGYVLEVSFGNFNMVERKMVILKEDKMEYLPSLPVISQSNYKAHKLLKEVLNGNYN